MDAKLMAKQVCLTAASRDFLRGVRDEGPQTLGSARSWWVTHDSSVICYVADIAHRHSSFTLLNMVIFIAMLMIKVTIYTDFYRDFHGYVTNYQRENVLFWDMLHTTWKSICWRYPKLLGDPKN